MSHVDPRSWMWSEAVAMLTRTERLHRQFFQPRSATQATQEVVWEPPVDVLELEHEVLILVALPGVNVDQVETTIEDGSLIVAGRRVLPQELGSAIIHRLELPQGRFGRRVPLPPGRYADVRRRTANGCLIISLQKTV